MEIDIHVAIQGPNFVPSIFEAKTGLLLDAKNEVGSIGTIGKYRGKPTPYGSAILRLSQPVREYGPQLKNIIEEMERNLATLRCCGGVDVVLWLVINCTNEEQMNLEFHPEEMGKLSSLGIPMAISQYTERG